jgi:Zn-dependent M32 family carboxypeptidase
MQHDAAYADLIRRVREASILGSCGSLLSWDESTYMPRQGSAYRGEQMGLLARLGHEMITAPIIGELLAAVESSELVRNPESDAAANVREIRRGYDRAVKVPAELVEELARVTTRAQQAWRDARKASDFAAFRPHLETIVDLLRKKADAIGYRVSRYDALLDEYEPGATAAEITSAFAALRAELVPLIAAIANSGRKPNREVLLSISMPGDSTRRRTPSVPASGRAIAGSPRATTSITSTSPFSACYTRRGTGCMSKGCRRSTPARRWGRPAHWAFTSRNPGSGKTRSAGAGRSGSIFSRAPNRPSPACATCR